MVRVVASPDPLESFDRCRHPVCSFSSFTVRHRSSIHLNQDEISSLIRMEMNLAKGDGSLSASGLAVAVLEMALEHDIALERDSFCDALWATAIPGGWKDAMTVFRAMKKAGHSTGFPVFDIMTQVPQRVPFFLSSESFDGRFFCLKCVCVVTCGVASAGVPTDVWEGA